MTTSTQRAVSDDLAILKEKSAIRKTALIVGVLFIAATALSLLSSSLTGPVTGASDYLASASANSNQMILGSAVLIAAGISVALIAAMLYPVLKQYDEGLAMSYVAMRIVEGVVLVVDALAILMLLSSAQQYAKAVALAAVPFQASGTMWLAAFNWLFYFDPIVFGLGAIVFYYVLYRAQLVPSWLSLWGLVGALLVSAYGFLGLFGSGWVYMAAPIGVQEMALAAWLIIKGFNPSAIVLKPRSSL